jgi:hypothetical protein
MTDSTERAASEMVVAATHNDKVGNGSSDRREQHLDRATLFDNGFEGDAGVGERATPVVAQAFRRPCQCQVVQLLSFRFVTEMKKRGREFERMHCEEVRVTAVPRGPSRGIRCLGKTVDTNHDLTHQSVGLEQICDGHDDDRQGAYRGDLIRDAAHREPSKSTAAPTPEHDQARVQVMRGLQDRRRGMAVADDGAQLARRGFSLSIPD